MDHLYTFSRGLGRSMGGLGEGLQPFPSRIPVVYSWPLRKRFLGSVWLFKGWVLVAWELDLFFADDVAPLASIFNSHWNGLHPSLKWLGSEMTPNNPNPQHEHGGEEIQNPGKDFTYARVSQCCKLLWAASVSPGCPWRQWHPWSHQRWDRRNKHFILTVRR